MCIRDSINQVGVVRDALVAHAVQHDPLTPWCLPVVAETYDGWLNDIGGFHVREEHVFAALANAAGGPVAEGNVGGGTGMICHGFKGGIGTSSRRVEIAGTTYTVGALVQANNLLFEPELRFGAPGEVVYDPAGRIDPETLEAIADRLYNEVLPDPAERAFIYSEHPRLGLAVPAQVSTWPLWMTGTYVAQNQLPDGLLSRSHFPLLVDDNAPGLVLPLPAALWPEALREAWLSVGEQRVGFRFDPRAARHKLAAARLGYPARIFVPEIAAPVKVARCEPDGVEVSLGSPSVRDTCSTPIV